MADIFVDSAATGSNNGTSKANAFTSIASTVGASAGDVILPHKTHAESPGANTTWNWSNGTIANPVRMVCIDFADDSLATGALIGNTTANTLVLQGNIYCRGITWRGGASVTIGNSAANCQVHENCSFTQSGTGALILGGGGRSIVHLTNPTIDFSGASGAGAIVTLSAYMVRILGGTYTPHASQTSNFGFASSTNAEIRGLGFSGTVTNIFDLGNIAADVLMQDCVLPSFTNWTVDSPDTEALRIYAERCTSGTITVPSVGPNFSMGRAGTVIAVLTHYRTGGAHDGLNANEHSWQMISNANAAEVVTPLRGPWMARRVSAGAAQNVTIYLATDGIALENDEFAIEVFSPSEAGSATSTGVYRTSRANILATPVALATDAVSTWNGSNVGTKLKVTTTISPTVAGVVYVRALLFRPSATVFVDPFVEVS